MIRTVKTRFPFNGLPKGHVFTYDPDTDKSITALIRSGLLEDITEEVSASVPAIVFSMPSIESELEMGEIGGEGEDQPHGGGVNHPEADDAAGADGVQGNQGAVPKVAKKR